MALPTIGVLDKDTNPQTINTLRSGRAAAADSSGVALSNEDLAVLDGLETAIASTNTKLDTAIGHIDGLETAIASTNTKLDTAITALQIIDNMVLAAGSANIGDVDVLTLPALVAGSAAIGKLAANSGVDIGDVDVLTLPALVAGSAVIGKVEHTTTGMGHGVKTVTTAGTDVVLAGSTAAKWVTVQAQTDNTGWIAVGATGVDATEATGTGVLLAAGESIPLAVDNLADVFIDSTVSGEGVRFTYGT